MKKSYAVFSIAPVKALVAVERFLNFGVYIYIYFFFFFFFFCRLNLVN